MSAARRIEKLRPDRQIEDFDCGRDELNRYLPLDALTNQQAGAGQAYVGLEGDVAVGHHTLTVGHVTRAESPERLTQGISPPPCAHHVPRAAGGRSALAGSRHRQGSSEGCHATQQAAEIGGIRALAVHAKDEPARSFYQKFDFIPSPTDPMHLFVLLKDVKRVISGA